MKRSYNEMMKELEEKWTVENITSTLDSMGVEYELKNKGGSKMKKRILAALKMWAAMMLVVGTPIAIGYLMYLLFNPAVAVISWGSLFMLAGFLLVTLTADWKEFK